MFWFVYFQFLLCSMFLNSLHVSIFQLSIIKKGGGSKIGIRQSQGIFITVSAWASPPTSPPPSFSPGFQGQQKHRQPDRVLILNIQRSVLALRVFPAAMGEPKSEVRNHRLDGGTFPKTQVSHPGKREEKE